ncbi:MAG: hypothetical protein WEE36_10895 [Acidimicrobiia bacterium]
MTARAQVMATVVRMSGPPDVIEFKKVARLRAHRSLVGLRSEVEFPESGDRGGKPYLIRFFRELH